MTATMTRNLRHATKPPPRESFVDVAEATARTNPRCARRVSPTTWRLQRPHTNELTRIPRRRRRRRARISRHRVPVKLLRLRHGCRDRRAHTHTHTRRTVRCIGQRPTRFRSKTSSYRDAHRAPAPDAGWVIARSVRIADPSRECRSRGDSRGDLRVGRHKGGIEKPFHDDGVAPRDNGWARER